MLNFKKRYLWVLFVLLVWLILANQIIVSLFVPSFGRIKEVDFDKLARKDTVYTIISAESAIGDLFDQFSVKGGAFCAVDEACPDRKVELILKSRRNTYQIEAVSELRPDLYYAYSDKIKMHSNIGFQVMFSTINLPNDVYDLYIEVIENDKVYGVGATGYKYIKDKNGFRPYEYDDVGKIPDIHTIGNITFRLDSIALKEGVLSLGGWQFLESSESALNDVYIQISNSTGVIKMLELKKRMRMDIARAFESDDYLISGITGEYDNMNFEDGEYVLRIVVKEEDNYYLSDECEKIVVVDGVIVSNEHNQ